MEGWTAPSLRIPRQRRIHPGDKAGKLLDVLPEELLCRRVGDLAVVGDQAPV